MELNWNEAEESPGFYRRDAEARREREQRLWDRINSCGCFSLGVSAPLRLCGKKILPLKCV